MRENIVMRGLDPRIHLKKERWIAGSGVWPGNGEPYYYPGKRLWPGI
jgi:hypothetical protein